MPVGIFDKATARQAEELLCYAATQLVAGESFDPIPEGEQVGGPTDTLHALPGAVLLTDRERVFLRKHDSTRKALMQDENELQWSARRAFLSGLTRTTFSNPSDNYEILNPYRKWLFDPEHGLYEREVDLYVFCLNKNYDVASIPLMQWRNHPRGAYVIAAAGATRLTQTGCFESAVTGATQNTTMPMGAKAYERLRSAHIAMRGTTEYAKAKKARAANRFRLSLSPRRT